MNFDIKGWYIVLLLITAGILPLYIIHLSLLGIPTNVFEVAVALLVSIGLFSGDIRESWIRTARSLPRGILAGIGLFFLSACISTLISHEIRGSLGILKGWVVVPMVFSFLLASAIKNNPTIKHKIVDSLIVSSVAVSGMGIVQIGSLARVRSLYDVPNSLALFVVPVAIIALYIGVQLKKRVYIVAAVTMFIAILATQSMGALGAILVTLAIAWIVQKKAGLVKNNLVIILVVILAAGGVLTSSGRLQYLASPLIYPSSTNSATVRLQLWDIGIRLIQQHPLLGIGLGQFEPAYQAELHRLFAGHAVGLQPEYVFRDPHNWIISFWLNVGIVGLVCFSYINFVAIRRSIQSKNIYQQAVGLALISILLFGLVDTIYWKNDLSVLWWVLCLYSFIEEVY